MDMHDIMIMHGVIDIHFMVIHDVIDMHDVMIMHDVIDMHVMIMHDIMDNHDVMIMHDVMNTQNDKTREKHIYSKYHKAKFISLKKFSSLF